jgi:hypothetical protein
MKMNKPQLIRQGDVLLLPIEKIPATAKRVNLKGKPAILAHGEVTGHHHSVTVGRAKLYSEPGRSGVYASTLEIAEAFADLSHQEHARIPLPVGAYEVRRQREYSPEAIRNVAD